MYRVWVKAIIVSFLIIILIITPSFSYAEFAMDEKFFISKQHVLHIDQMFQMKEDAVNKRNEEQFLSLLHNKNSKYMKEAKNWYRDAIKYADSGSYQLRIIKVRPLDKGICRVTLKQSYRKNGKSFHLVFDTLVIRDKQNWLDSDVFFHEINQNNVIVKFSDPGLETMAQGGAIILNKFVANFNEKFGWTPHQKLELKLYNKSELFRQSVKLSLPEWAVGWNEYGESIKFVGDDGYDKKLFFSGLKHEVTHQMLGEMTNDNAAYWMHEGLATYYEVQFIKNETGKKEVRQEEVIHKEEKLELPRPRWTIQEMMKVNLEELDTEEAKDYYYQAYLIMNYFIKNYGEDVLKNWMTELNKFPYVAVTTSEKLAGSNARTVQAFEKATGVSFHYFADLWNKQYFD
jgi:hypothetical protein